MISDEQLSRLLNKPMESLWESAGLGSTQTSR